MAATLGQAFSPAAQQQSYEDGGLYQSRLAQSLAQIGASDAAARAHDSTAQLNGAKTGMLTNRGDVFNEQVAAAAGTDVPTVHSFRNKLDGTPDMVDMGPPTEDGQLGTTPMPFDPELVTRMGKAMRQFFPLLTNSGDINPEQLAKATGEYRDQGLSDKVIAGELGRNTVAGAQAAAAGKPLFHENGNGAVLDQYGGGLDTSNPLAQATIAERQAAARRNDQQGTAAVTRANRPGRGESPNGPGYWNGIKPDKGFRFKDDGSGEQEPIPGGKQGPSNATPKPMPAQALKLEQEERDALSVATGIDKALSDVQDKLSSGALVLSTMGNLESEARNKLGVSSPNSANYATFRATLEKMRNDSLRLNKGVQTEGDAQRAWNELIANINDQGIVSQRLNDIRAINRRAIEARTANIELIRKNYGGQAPDLTPYGGQLQPAAPANQAASVPGSTRVTPQAQAARDDAAAQQEAQRGATAIGRDLVQLSNELNRPLDGSARAILMQQQRLLTRALQIAKAGGGAASANMGAQTTMPAMPSLADIDAELARRSNGKPQGSW